jgi:hypothetical protein
MTLLSLDGKLPLRLDDSRKLESTPQWPPRTPRSDEVGSIEKGKLADFVVLD